MAENKKLFRHSPSPHVKAPKSTKCIMANVCIALIPACVAGIMFFGQKAAIILILSCLSAVLSEFIYLLIVNKKPIEILKQFDFTSLVTGMLLGMSIGTNYPIYAPVIGSMFAIIAVKMIFGGTGKNIVNPAVTGRIFVFLSFQSVVTAWVIPGVLSPVTGSTILGNILENGVLPSSTLDLLFGVGVAGCIGETCKIALILGALYLAVLGIINIGLPLLTIASCGLFTVCLNGFNFNYYLPSILSGGLILGSFFMATDYTTTPNTKLGNVIYFLVLGLVTAGLRQATKMEVVSFAILLMNLFVPLIDKFIRPRPFGAKKVKGGKA